MTGGRNLGEKREENGNGPEGLGLKKWRRVDEMDGRAIRKEQAHRQDVLALFTTHAISERDTEYRDVPRS